MQLIAWEEDKEDDALCLNLKGKALDYYNYILFYPENNEYFGEVSISLGGEREGWIHSKELVAFFRSLDSRVNGHKISRISTELCQEN